MKDEIKEIERILATSGKYITYTERNYVLDYITNLQEQLHQASLDIQELTEKDIGCPSWCDKLTNLQEEKDKYKNVIDKIKEYVKEWREDDGSGSYGTLELLELLEEVE